MTGALHPPGRTVSAESAAAGTAGGVPDLTDEFLEHVLQRDDTERAASVDDSRKVRAGTLQKSEDLVQPGGGGDLRQRPDGAARQRAVAAGGGHVQDVRQVEVADEAA